MNKNEFLETLEKCLGKLPNEERINALEYYKEYLDEIPAENEEEQIAKLGNPSQIAQRLILEFSTGETQTAEHKTQTAEHKTQTVESKAQTTEYKMNNVQKSQQNNTRKNVYGMAGNDINQSQKKEVCAPNLEHGESKSSVWKLIFAVLSAPITIPFAIALVAVVASLIILFGSVILVVFAVSVAVGISAVATTIVGIMAISSSVGGGLITIGVGLMLWGASVILSIVAQKICSALYKSFGKIVSKFIKRGYECNEEK